MITPHHGSRLASVDFWRGFALVMIFINHIPGNILEPFTHKNFGFSDAAEIFVFLAGMGVAFAYAGRVAETGFARQVVSIGIRVVTLYTSHIVVLLACGAIVSFAVMATNDIRLLEATQFDQLVESPMEALVGLTTLGLQPAYLNILPLYVVLLVLAPALISLALIDLRLAMLVSGALYVATQLFALSLPSYPGNSAWYFNPLAWQFLFTMGLCGGLMIQRDQALRSRALFCAALAYVLGALLWTRAGFYHSADLAPLPRFLWDFDKTNLTLPRLLHVLALVYITSRLPLERVLARSPFAKLFILLGSYSLPVFCVGTILSVSAQVFRMTGAGSPVLDIVLIASGLLIQVGLAALLEWHRFGPPRKAPSARASRTA
jgi:hypothetical protein